jgi:hypothetical protein
LQAGYEDLSSSMGDAMDLYHGSNVPVEIPRLLRQSRGLDFGSGFYLTSSQKQADSFSHNVFRRAKTGIPMVSVYKYDTSMAERKLDILRFANANVAWLEFVKDNRLKSYTGKQYDVIIGPVANDDVLPSILAFVSGQFNVEAALISLKTKKLFDQYCFASERAISLLRFKESYIPNEVK